VSKPRLAKVVTMTAVLTFLATTLGGWAITRIADRVVSDLSPEVSIDMTTPLHDNLSVSVPPTTDLTNVRIPSDPQVAYQWAVNQGGGPANVVTASLTVWGNKDRPIVLTGIRARNVHCEPVPQWPHIYPLGGGEIGERMVEIDLDSGNLNAMPVENAVTGEVFQFPLQVTKSEVEAFRILVSALNSNCTYQLELGYREDGTTKYVPIGAGPYRVISSSQASTTYRWTEVDPALDRSDPNYLKLEPCPSDECTY
jgi:hypothetical protein